LYDTSIINSYSNGFTRVKKKERIYKKNKEKNKEKLEFN